MFVLVIRIWNEDKISVCNRNFQSNNNNNNNNNYNIINNNRKKWKYLSIIQKILEQHNGKARNQGIRENSHIGHGTRTSGSTNVKAQNVALLTLEIELYVCTLNSNYRLAATLYVLGKCFVSVI